MSKQCLQLDGFHCNFFGITTDMEFKTKNGSNHLIALSECSDMTEGLSTASTSG